MVHYYECSSEEDSGEQAESTKVKKTEYDHKTTKNSDENDKVLVNKEMSLSNIGNDIFIGDSAGTSQLTNNKTGVYNLTPINAQ